MSAALKGVGERGNWARERARGARGERKREKSEKGPCFILPRAPEFLLSLSRFTPATQATPLSETLHSNFEFRR